MIRNPTPQQHLAWAVEDSDGFVRQMDMAMTGSRPAYSIIKGLGRLTAIFNNYKDANAEAVAARVKAIMEDYELMMEQMFVNGTLPDPDEIGRYAMAIWTLATPYRKRM